jgi:hypothetical protein
MISEIDTALRNLLLRELPLRKGEIDIVFDQPKRQWSSQVNKPTLNLFLLDIKENVEFRGSEQLMREKNDDGTITVRRNPVRIDLIYLITGWTREIQDEHHLLSVALLVLLRNPFLPVDLTPEGLKSASLPVRIEVARVDAVLNLTDLWSTLDNELHAGLRLTVTLAIDPYKPEVIKQVQETQWRFVQHSRLDNPEEAAIDEPPDVVALSRVYYSVSGKIVSQKYSPGVIKLVVKENGQQAKINAQGEYLLHGLYEGDYAIDVIASDRILKVQKIHVPSSDYDIQV